MRDALVFLIAFCAAAYVFGIRKSDSTQPLATCEIRVCHDPQQKEERVVKLCGQAKITVTCRTKEEVWKLTRELFAMFANSSDVKPVSFSTYELFRKLSL